MYFGKHCGFPRAGSELANCTSGDNWCGFLHLTLLEKGMGGVWHSRDFLLKFILRKSFVESKLPNVVHNVCQGSRCILVTTSELGSLGSGVQFVSGSRKIVWDFVSNPIRCWLQLVPCMQKELKSDGTHASR